MGRMNYSELLQKHLSAHSQNKPGSETEIELIFDTERDRYQVIH